MMPSRNEAMIHVPSFRERVWRRLGFQYHLGDEPVGCEALQGWMRTDIRLHFGWADRFRLLASGKLFVASIVHSDTSSPAICKSRVDWRIEQPGHRPLFSPDGQSTSREGERT